jgi:simple sugar transport system permease protein
MMIAGAVTGGAFWGMIAGMLRVYRGVQEVISTIMLNYIALYIVSWLVLGPLRAKGNYLAETDSLSNSVLFARLIPSAWSDHIQTTLHVGVIMALLAAPASYLFLYRTRTGFNMRILGSNSEAARVAKLPVDRLKIAAMSVSGGIAGLAGAVILLGSPTGSLPATSFGGTIGFTAIPVALLGGLHPIGSLVSAVFFGGLTQGCRNLEQNTGVSSVVIYIIQAAAVLAVVGARAVRERKEAAQA